MDDIDRATEQTELYQRTALYKSRRPVANEE